MNISKASQHATRLSSFANFTNGIIGVGILGLPYALANTGWVLGILLLVGCGIVSVFATHILAHCADKSGYPSSFYSVAKISFPRFAILIDIANLLYTFLGCTAFLIAVGGLMPQVMLYFGVTGLFAERITWIVISFLIGGSLTFPHNVDGLKYSSLFALAVEVFLIIIVVIFAQPSVVEPCQGFVPSAHRPKCIGDMKMFNSSVDALKVLPMFVFSFGCISNLFPVLNELEAPTLKRWDSVAFASIGCAAVLYTTVACCGYFTYGSEIQSNLLLSYPSTSLLSTARLSTSLQVTLAYPLLAMAGRYSVLSLCRLLDDGSISLWTPAGGTENHICSSSDCNVDANISLSNVGQKTEQAEEKSEINIESGVLVKSSESQESSKVGQLMTVSSAILMLDRNKEVTCTCCTFPFSVLGCFHEHFDSIRYYVATASFIFGTLLVAIVTPDLGIMIRLTGATGGSVLAFVLPGLAYYVLHKNSPPSVFKYLSLAMLGFGAVFIPVSVYFIFAG